MLFQRHAIQYGCGQPARLGTEYEYIAWREAGVAVNATGARPDAEQACNRRELGEALIEADVHVYPRELVVVEACAADGLALDIKAQGSDQVQGAARIRAETDHIAGIGRDLRLKEHDVE